MELDPDAAAFLARTTGAPRLQDGTPDAARAGHVAAAPALAGTGPWLPEVCDERVAGVPVRRYVPPVPYGTTVFVHGGGWVVGTLDTYDVVCRELAVASGSTVLSVDYDLAPEARHPRQLEQVLAVVRATPGPVAVAGDSAGGYLAALVAQSEPVVAQALVYPATDPALDTPSAVDNATGHYLETEAMRWYWGHLLGEGAHTPLEVRPGMPPAYVVTAGFDPLRDEARAHADALERVGVPVVRDDHDGQVHGFVRMTGVMADARPVLHDVGQWLRTHLLGSGREPSRA